MHPAFENLDILTFDQIIQTEGKCISVLEDIGLIPKKKDAPACPVCSGSMGAVDRKNGWMWLCKIKTCSGSVNPLENTFFSDFDLPLKDIVLVVLLIIFKDNLQTIIKISNNFKKRKNESIVKDETYELIHNKCRKVCEIIMSQKYERLVRPYSSTLYLLYRKRKMDTLKDFGPKAYQFFMDIKCVYPGYGKKGLNYKLIQTSS